VKVKMKISICQLSPSWEKIEDSIADIENLLPSLPDNVDLLLFPEMTLTGYTMKSNIFAEEPDGVCTGYFINLSRRLKTNIIAGLIEKDGDKIYNSAVHFDRTGIITARYRKIHPFSMAGEEKYYNGGSELVSTKIEGILSGLTVCYDLRFPELYRKYTQTGTKLLINISNWPVPRISHWEILLRARAVENLSCIVGVNRVGNDPYNEYSGNSLIYDSMGNEILSCGNKEGIFNAELNIDEVDITRSKLNFLNDIKLI
jgi:predicted amidohydrolase